MTDMESLLQEQASILLAHRGPPPEQEGERNDFNDLQRRILDAFWEQHNGGWLGKINLKKEDGPQEALWSWNGETFVYNFGAEFIVPAHDEELERLILARRDAPYTGTEEDERLLNPIFTRIEELEGWLLFWS